MIASPLFFKRLSVLLIFFFSFAGVVYLEQLNAFAHLMAEEYSELMRVFIFAFYCAVYLSGYVARVGKQNTNFIYTVQNLFTALPPFLGGYQLTVWLILDANLSQPEYLPYADVIDSSVFIIAIILLFKLSAEHLIIEIHEITKALSKSKTVKVTASKDLVNVKTADKN